VPDVIARARRAIGTRRAAQIADPEAARAAVALVLARRPEPSLLLVRRRERVGDPWSGHMALPGGYSSTTDATLEVTAVRETMEETGIDLAAGGELIGALDDLSPRSPYLPLIVVRPFVFAVDTVQPAAASAEVDEVVWLKVAELFDAANQKPLTFAFPDGPRTFDSLQLRGYTIWGLTERILTQFRSLLNL
jgi:8-oxo-dGTP pyrophosphatase MutT (NUDIX family)